MQKWLTTIRSFSMLANHKNKKARYNPGFFIFVKRLYLKEFRGASPNIRK